MSVELREILHRGKGRAGWPFTNYNIEVITLIFHGFAQALIR